MEAEIYPSQTVGGAQPRELEKGTGELLNSFPVTSHLPLRALPGPTSCFLAWAKSSPRSQCPTPEAWARSRGIISGEAPTPQAAQARCECALRKDWRREKGGEMGGWDPGAHIHPTQKPTHTHSHTHAHSEPRKAQGNSKLPLASSSLPGGGQAQCSEPGN